MPVLTGQKKPERIPTVRVESDESPSGYVIINRADFDASMHTRHASDPGDDGELLPTDVPAPVVEDDDDVGGAEFPGQSRIPTMRVTSDETALGYLIINASDFDASVHEPYDPPAVVGVGPDLSERGESDIDAADLSHLSFPRLRALAKSHGLRSTGTRAQIEAALLDVLTAPDSPPREATTDGESGE